MKNELSLLFEKQNGILERQNSLIVALIKKQDSQKRVIENIARMICIKTLGEGYNRKHYEDLVKEMVHDPIEE